MSTAPTANRTDPANWTASAEFLSHLLEQLTQPFAVTDRGRFQLWNRAFEELSGYSPADLPKMCLPSLMPPSGPTARPALAVVEPERGSQSGARTAQIRSGGRCATERRSTELRTKHGLGIPVEVRTVEIESPDCDPLLLTVFENISERQRLEAELRQSQKMEAIGKLAGGIAHDFNNVLTTILGLTESMIAGRSAPSSESLREIHQAARHAAELTQGLLAFSRRQILQMKNTSLDVVVASIAKMVARLIGEDIRLDTSCEQGLPAIRADCAHLEQVLLNLCLNARDAMPKGGELQVRARMEVPGEPWRKHNAGLLPDPYVVLSVRDTGEGMDEETLRRVFEPFFTRKAPGKGTGLGLSMVYGIVQQHDAFIHVISELGEGTEFAIYFPPSAGAPDAAQPQETPVTKIGNATILVVEDEHSVRRLVLEVLSKLGYRTFAAANGEEAVKVFERWSDQINLVLLDAILPKKGAREVYDQIRIRKPDVRFVFTSGYNEVFINQKFELDPSFIFLRKPFTTLELISKIQSALG